MRIAIIQTLYPQGHKSMDIEFVKILSTQHELIVLDDGEYFPDFSDNKNINRIRLPQLRIKRWELLKRFLRRLNILLIFFTLIIKRIHYDVIIILNCDNDIYNMEKWMPKKRKILMHHNDIDLLLKSVKGKEIFDKKKHCFIHVFLADYIRENFIKQFDISPEYAYTVHEPLKYTSPLNAKKENLIICLGNNTNETFINDLIKLDNDSNESLIVNKLIIRSKIKIYNGNSLQVIKGYLSNKEYESFFDRAKVCVVYYPDNYKYRYSGVIDDALNKRLVVYSNNTLCGQYFAKMYPNSVKIIKNAAHLWKLMKESLPSLPDSEMDLFISRHSSQYVLEQFNAVIYM